MGKKCDQTNFSREIFKAKYLQLFPNDNSWNLRALQAHGSQSSLPHRLIIQRLKGLSLEIQRFEEFSRRKL